MKRYLVFEYEEYYPSGGMNDLVSQTDDIEVAKAHIDSISDGVWIEIYDTAQCKMVFSVKGERVVRTSKFYHIKDYENYTK